MSSLTTHRIHSWEENVPISKLTLMNCTLLCNHQSCRQNTPFCLSWTNCSLATYPAGSEKPDWAGPLFHYCKLYMPKEVHLQKKKWNIFYIIELYQWTIVFVTYHWEIKPASQHNISRYIRCFNHISYSSSQINFITAWKHNSM